jgi:hypothetical protein
MMTNHDQTSSTVPVAAYVAMTILTLAVAPMSVDAEALAEAPMSTGESPTTAVTRNALITDRHWNENTKVWIARALVAEAGWHDTVDHIAIAYVLFRRWQIARRTFPNYSLISVIKRYCTGFGRTAASKRQRWIKNLSADGRRPKGWPGDIRWLDYRDRWLSVIETVDSWRNGYHPDPCRGLSRYWGGPMDKPSRRMIRMDCGPTKNFFYTVKRTPSK